MLKNVVLALALVGAAADPCSVLDGNEDGCNRCCEESTTNFVVDCVDYRCGWDYENLECVDIPIPQRKLRFGEIERPGCCKTLPFNAVCPE